MSSSKAILEVAGNDMLSDSLHQVIADRCRGGDGDLLLEKELLKKIEFGETTTSSTTKGTPETKPKTKVCEEEEMMGETLHRMIAIRDRHRGGVGTAAVGALHWKGDKRCSTPSCQTQEHHFLSAVEDTDLALAIAESQRIERLRPGHIQDLDETLHQVRKNIRGKIENGTGEESMPSAPARKSFGNIESATDLDLTSHGNVREEAESYETEGEQATDDDDIARQKSIALRYAAADEIVGNKSASNEDALASSSRTHSETFHSDSNPDNSSRRQWLGKSNIDSSSSLAEPGAYAGVGGSYGRLDTINNVAAFLSIGSSRHEDLSSGRDLNDEEQGQHTIVKTETRTATIRFKVLVLALVFIVVLVVTLSIAIPLLLTGRSSQEAQSKLPQAGTDADLIPGLAEYTLDAFQIPFSVQANALEWVTKDTAWNSYARWRKQQRFAMACIMFATKHWGDQLSASTSELGASLLWFPSGHECSWHFNGISTMCNEDTVVGLLWTATRNIEGSIPPEISHLSSLTSLNFSGSPVENEGTAIDVLLPLNTANAFPSLKELHLSGCNLGGSIPSTLGLLTSLTSLDLSINAIVSTIPSELGLLSDLEVLTLSYNHLSKTIPTEVGELSVLISFSAEHNSGLESMIPTGFCKDDRTPFDTLSTDWCNDFTECCAELR